jgi:N-methylhydantoinase B
MSNWSNIIPTVVDTIITALAKAMPDKVPAAHHGLLGGAVVFFGNKPDTGKRFIVQSLEGGGWGGRPHEDGESGSVSICQGDVRNGTLEGIELQNPVVVLERSLRPGSGGAGKHRGGLGVDLKIRNLVEGRWNLGRPRRVDCPPWGLWGGKPGGTAAYLLKLPNEGKFQEVNLTRHLVPPDSEVIVRTGGGGGWGDPLDRDPGQVRDDVREGYIGPTEAREDYGVVLAADGLTLDREATERLRAQRRTGERGKASPI